MSESLDEDLLSPDLKLRSGKPRSVNRNLYQTKSNYRTELIQLMLMGTRLEVLNH